MRAKTRLPALKAGDKVLVDIFEDAKYVDVVGTSKGRGFAGVVRRHHFGGGPKAHGHMFQVQGSIGASSFPSRVFPGQRMPGHFGAERVTVRNLRIRGIDLDENLLMVEGAIPGPRDGYVMISKSKAPPRERRGFGGGGTVDPLKASKKASGGKPSGAKGRNSLEQPASRGQRLRRVEQKRALYQGTTLVVPKASGNSQGL